MLTAVTVLTKFSGTVCIKQRRLVKRALRAFETRVTICQSKRRSITDMFVFRRFYFRQHITNLRYGLDGPGIEYLWVREFPHSSRPALRPT